MHRVDPAKYKDFALNPSIPLAVEVCGLLEQAGFDVSIDPNFEQIHDTL
jgi:hypothetical protein